jgi:predicted  nucleic acid-binding Zn-ribbon protein
VDQWVTLLITGVLSGGLFSGLTIVLKGRSEVREIDARTDTARARLPADVDSVVVQSAEQALEMQKHVNESLVAELARRDDVIARKDAHIMSLETKIAALSSDLASANNFGHDMVKALAQANERYGELQREVAAYRNTPPLPPQE